MRQWTSTLVCLAILGFPSQVFAERRSSSGNARSSFLRFNLGAAVVLQGSNNLATGAIGYGPTIIPLGPIQIHAVAEAVLAKNTNGDFFLIANGGGAVGIDMGVFSLHGGVIWQYWSATEELLQGIYGALGIWFDRRGFFQGLQFSYTNTTQTWGTVHLARASIVVAF